MQFSTVRWLLVQAALAWALPYQQTFWTPSISTFRQFQVTTIRSEVAQGVSLFCLLVDQHRFTEMEKVFTSPEVYISLPQDGFRNQTRLDTFVQNLYTYADYPFQHAIGVPVVEVEESMTVAHVTSPLIATVFDSPEGEKASPNEAEYGFYITDHILTNDGWRIQNMTGKALGVYLGEN